MLKKTLIATLTGSILLASGASFADPYYGNGRREVVEHERFHRPAPRPVVVHEYYRPRPVFVERRVVVQRPAPVYAGSDGLAILAGAVLGGAIAYQIATH
jgi:hypothetical protein